MRVVVMVLLILLAVGLVQAAIWIPLTRRWRRRSEAATIAFDAELLRTGERTVLGPEKAVYRGGSGPFSAVDGSGTIVLTDRRLVFRKVTSGSVEVSRDTITGTRQSKSFRGSRVGGRVHLVISTDDPAEVGFFVADTDRWEAALRPPQPSDDPVDGPIG